MADSGDQDWKKSLGSDAANAESERMTAKSKASSDAAASSVGRQHDRQRFTRKVNTYIDTLRNKAIYDLEEVNRNVGTAPRGSVVPTSSHGFEIWRQFPYDRLPEAFGKPQVPPKYVTAMKVSFGTTKLFVHHPEESGEQVEEFILEESADDESLVVKDRNEVVSMESLIQRIVTPIFRVRKAAR